MLGYFTDSVTNNYGSKTKAAVQDFQRVNGLPITGTCDKNTHDLLMSSKAKSKNNATVKPTAKPTATPKPTAKPTGKPTATPNGVIIAQKGMKGSDTVRQIQARLISLGYMSGSATGNYLDGTVTAVKAFQTAHKLSATGKVDKSTYNLLMSSKAKPKSSTSKTTVKPTASPKTNQYLQYGSSGTAVTQLQNRLIELGYLAGATTGEWGGCMEAAVRAYQSRNGLYSDGVAGPDTLKSVYSSSAKKATAIAGIIGVTLKSADQGVSVKALQTRLKKLGYLTSAANGSYGQKTVDAVKAFQADNSLSQTGKADQKTLNAIFDVNAKSK